jgi:hypothetical protein
MSEACAHFFVYVKFHQIQAHVVRVGSVYAETVKVELLFLCHTP